MGRGGFHSLGHGSGVGPFLGKLGQVVPLLVGMELSLFCEMSFAFLDRVFIAVFGGKERPDCWEGMLGHLREGKAGGLFRKVELKIEHCHSAVAWVLQTLGSVPLLLSLHSLYVPAPFPLCDKGTRLCAESTRMQPL